MYLVMNTDIGTGPNFRDKIHIGLAGEKLYVVVSTQ